jgi:hypothetical protein
MFLPHSFLTIRHYVFNLCYDNIATGRSHLLLDHDQGIEKCNGCQNSLEFPYVPRLKMLVRGQVSQEFLKIAQQPPFLTVSSLIKSRLL